MSEHESLEPLDPEIAAMLGRARERLDVPGDEVAARLWGRLEGSIGAGGGGGGGGGGAGLAVKGGALAAAAAIGAVIGVLVHARVSSSDSRSVTTPSASSISSAVATAAHASTPEPSSSVATISIDALPRAASNGAPSTATAHTQPAVSIPTNTVSPTNDDDALVAERKLLDRARAALGAGDPTTALAACDEHARDHARGRLVEEREALRVRALSAAGRTDEARVAAGRFEASFPGSVLLPAVRAAAAK